MAVSTGNEYLWAFVHWAERNPHNSLNSVHWDEIKKMIVSFNLVNTTDGGTATAADPLAYGVDVDIPGKATANTDTNGIDFTAPTDAKCEQSKYPEQHIFVA